MVMYSFLCDRLADDYKVCFSISEDLCAGRNL